MTLFLKEVNIMVASPLFGFPSATAAGLDMTADFAPLFVGLVVVLGLCVLGLVFAIGVHDTWWDKRTEKKAPHQPIPAPHYPEAA
jgi:hypothetical protein